VVCESIGQEVFMKILIGTDGSAHSRKAVEECCRLFAETRNLEVKIASTYETIVPLDAFGVAARNVEQDWKTAEENAERIVRSAEKTIRKRLPQVKTETDVALDYPEHFIIEQARDWKADLIVVGSHGRGFLGRLALGSVSDAIVHHAPCPVMVVHET
jgi:nucleotide-binding universal stress UspA family protein